jgi:sterol O-acyltransferase
MSTSAEITADGNGSVNHDHILRPRALKPGNPGVLRAQIEEGLLAVAHETGNSSGQTRCVFPQILLRAKVMIL